MNISFRPAVAADAGFLTKMLAVAAFWQDDQARNATEDIRRDPRLARYIAAWPQPGDLGVIAETTRPIGAAWIRFFTADEPGYGFLGETTPEIAMGVEPAWRGQGVGSQLLEQLITAAEAADIATLSLSVAAANPARRLYERAGFRHVTQSQGSITMILHKESRTKNG